MAENVNSASAWENAKHEEELRVENRRGALRDMFSGWVPPQDHVGLALSGGGIRSATFSLGLLRSLSRAKLIHSLDYLSTVSGGGYAGSFYCSLFVPQKLRGSGTTEQRESEQSGGGANGDLPPEVRRHVDDLGEDPLGSEHGAQAVAQLRQGGHYLTPNGTTDALFAAVVAIRNWFAVALVNGAALLAIFLTINLLQLIAAELFAFPEGWLDPDLRKELFGFHIQPYWPVLLWLVSLGISACSWAFWYSRSTLVGTSRIWRLASIQSLAALLLGASATAWGFTREDNTSLFSLLAYWVALTCLVSFIAYALAHVVNWKAEADGEAANLPRCAVEALAEEDRVRSRLSAWLFGWVKIFLVVAAVATIDIAARNIAELELTKLSGGELVFPPLLAALIPFARSLMRRQIASASVSTWIGRLLQRSKKLMMLAAGFFLLILALLFWAVLARIITDHDLANGQAGGIVDPLELWDFPAPGVVQLTLLLAVCSLLWGYVDSFLNRSSLASFYAARLRKAYLGATNEHRHGPRHHAVDRDDRFDDISLDNYYHPTVVAPLHLINVTINETTSKSSRVIQRDRKGKSLTVSPAGYLYPEHEPKRELARVPRGDERTCGETLPLSSWIAISGAAFSTGAGHHTNLGVAILASMANMRLGYWWYRSRYLPWQFWKRQPSQVYFLREMRASYRGTEASRWYLSDGGHYENTGVYELVRRRVPFIIASDNGADPRYEFSDLVNLIRKLRIDFGAEVEFLDQEQLDGLFLGSALHEVFGTLDRMREHGEEASKAEAGKGKDPPAGPYATLARIRYPEEEPGVEPPPSSTLLLIKPRITGRELPDLLQYRESDAAFPQQPTTDQFFDEAQWESYYRLGQLIGDAVFDRTRFGDATDGLQWAPWSLARLPEPDHIRPRTSPPAAETDAEHPQST